MGRILSSKVQRMQSSYQQSQRPMLLVLMMTPKMKIRAWIRIYMFFRETRQKSLRNLLYLVEHLPRFYH